MASEISDYLAGLDEDRRRTWKDALIALGSGGWTLRAERIPQDVHRPTEAWVVTVTRGEAVERATADAAEEAIMIVLARAVLYHPWRVGL